MVRLAEVLYFDVEVLDPYDEVTYLGVWVQSAMFTARAAAEATQQAEEVAGALASTSIESWEATPVARCTGGQRMCYSLRCIAILPDMMSRLDTRMREMLKTKHGHCRSYPNDAFDAAQYNSLEDMVLVDKISMLLRLVHLNHPAASAVKGMLYEAQRSYGSHTPILEADDVHKSGWHGTWVSALASWLSVRDISIKGGRGIPWRCEGDLCLVDAPRSAELMSVRDSTAGAHHAALVEELECVADAARRGAPLVAGSAVLLALKRKKGEAKLAAKRAEDEVEEGRQQLAQGCSKFAAWRYSDLLRHDGSPRADLVGPHGWGSRLMKGDLVDKRWCTRAATMAEDWWTDQVRCRGVVRQWDPAHVAEHKYLARVGDEGDVHLCRVVKGRHNAELHTQGGSDRRTVEVEWLTRHIRAEWVAEHGSVVLPLEKWLESRGGSGGGRRGRSVSGSPYREWLWGVEDQQVSGWSNSSREPIMSLVPVTVTEVDIAETWGVNGHGTVVLVDEPSQWWLNAAWAVPGTEWVFPRDRVVGLQFRDHSTTGRQVAEAQQAWLRSLHTQAQCWTQSPVSTPVLYSYSDCSLDRVSGYVRVSYGWVTAGVANQHLVREVGPPGSGMWRLDPGESAWDLTALEKGTWGGGVVDGPKEDHSTFRGEAFGLLATLVWLEGSEWQVGWSIGSTTRQWSTSTTQMTRCTRITSGVSTPTRMCGQPCLR